MTTQLPRHYWDLVSNIRGAEANRQVLHQEARGLLTLAEEEFTVVTGRALELFAAEQARTIFDNVTQELRDMITLIRLARGLPIEDIGEISGADLIKVLKSELSGLISETRNGEVPDEGSQISGAGESCCPENPRGGRPEEEAGPPGA